MGEQSVDLRSTWVILRRHRPTLAASALVGAAAGVAWVTYQPPMYSSASMVLLPPAQSSDGQQVDRQVDTEIRIAGSDVVLGAAAKAVHPSISADDLEDVVDITAPTSDVIRFEAHAEDADRAKDLAEAMADAELTYVSGASAKLHDVQRTARENRVSELEETLDTVNREVKATKARRDQEVPGSAAEKAYTAALAQLTAQQASLVLQIDQVRENMQTQEGQDSGTLIQEASPPRRPGLVSQYLLFGLGGLLGLTGLTALLVAIFGRRDRRLRFRDEIADALGSTVIASVKSQPATTVAGWTALLERYEPRTVDSWALRQALRHLVPGAFFPGPHHEMDGSNARPVTVSVLCLSDDPRALAIGPQLASYAASAGLTTRLVPAHGHDSAAALWAACAQVPAHRRLRPNLRLEAGNDEADLTLLMTVVDRQAPSPEHLPADTVTVLAISSGNATAEDLARTAVAADDVDSRISGVVVADPDDLDRTTGRLLQTERSQEAHLPARLTGVPGGGPNGDFGDVARLRKDT